MGRARGLHIGLNEVDPDCYQGWGGELDAGENDAQALALAFDAFGFDTATLLSTQATVDAVFGKLDEMATTLSAGDICVVTYAGHGGQFADISSDESDDADETWCLYDREILDDEIHVALARFARGVRFVVISDSCHSGTVVRARYARWSKNREFHRSYGAVAPNLPTRRNVRTSRQRPLAREVPGAVQSAILRHDRALYANVRARTPRKDEIDMPASGILLAACQDNQEAFELDGHGLFTAAMLEQLARGAPLPAYRDLCRLVAKELPPTQSPALLSVGRPWDAFVQQNAFTITMPDAAPKVETDADGVGPASTPNDKSYRMTVTVELAIKPSDPLGRKFFSVLSSLEEVAGVTGAENTDMQAESRGGAADLDEEQRRELTRMYRTGNYSLDELADVLAVSAEVVRRALPNRAIPPGS